MNFSNDFDGRFQNLNCIALRSRSQRQALNVSSNLIAILQGKKATDARNEK